MTDLIKGSVWPWGKTDLIARLLAEETDLTDCAADHIEQTEAKLTKAVEALREISAEASVPVHTWKNGINFKKMYEGWRKIAVQKIDIARAALDEMEGKE